MFQKCYIMPGLDCEVPLSLGMLSLHNVIGLTLKIMSSSFVPSSNPRRYLEICTMFPGLLKQAHQKNVHRIWEICGPGSPGGFRWDRVRNHDN